MTIIRDLVKVLLGRFSTNEYVQHISSSLINQNGVFPIILHHIPTKKMGTFKKLVVELRNRYDFIEPGEFSSAIKSEKIKLLLTFDDGFYSNYLVAKEILDPLGIHAIFFVPTGFLDAKSRNKQKKFIVQNIYKGKYFPDFNPAEMMPMGWENLSELISNGHLIGSHSINHLRLSEMDNTDLLEEEIILSGDRIEEILGTKVEHFAFPFGDIGSISKKALDIAGTRYKYIYSGIRGRNTSNTNPLAIRRESLNISDEIAYNTFVAGGGLSFYYWTARRRLDAMIS